MFGVVTIARPRCSLWRRLLLRVFPSKGLTVQGGHYRMAMYFAACVTAPAGWKDIRVEKCVREALLQLRQRGVRRVILPPDYQRLAEQYDMARVSRRAALEACGSQAVLQACRELKLPPETVCVTVCGDRIPRAAASQVLTLAGQVRSVRLCGSGNGALANQLWRSCGITPGGILPEGVPSVAMVLDGTPTDCKAAVDLTDGQHPAWPVPVWLPKLVPPPDAAAKLPEGADGEAFTAALYLCGALQAREIRISRLDIP